MIDVATKLADMPHALVRSRWIYVDLSIEEDAVFKWIDSDTDNAVVAWGLGNSWRGKSCRDEIVSRKTKSTSLRPFDKVKTPLTPGLWLLVKVSMNWRSGHHSSLAHLIGWMEVNWRFRLRVDLQVTHLIGVSLVLTLNTLNVGGANESRTDQSSEGVYENLVRSWRSSLGIAAGPLEWSCGKNLSCRKEGMWWDKSRVKLNTMCQVESNAAVWASQKEG